MKLTPPSTKYIVDLGREVERGEEVEVDEDLGARLLEQGWREPPVKRRRGASASAGQQTTVEPDPGDESPDSAEPAPTEE